MRSPLILVLLTLTACLPAARRALRADELLQEHYQHEPIQGQTRASVKDVVQSLPQVTLLGCLSALQPCQAPTLPNTDLCLRWGESTGCHTTEDTPSGVLVRPFTPRPLDPRPFDSVDRWLYASLDEGFDDVVKRAEAQADDEISVSEERPVSAHTFWAQARAVVRVPALRLGLQVQGGYRRWLSQYVLVSVGGGYERHAAGALGVAFVRDAALITARLEFSSYQPDVQARLLSLPVVAGYVGLTGVLGVSGEGWSTRTFIGFSSVVPISVELGLEVAVMRGVPTAPNLYVAAGLGI